MRAPALLSLFLIFEQVSSYFLITQPSADSHWQNGVTNALTWTKGKLDGIYAFDFEIARLNSDGLILVARDIPTSTESLSTYLEDVPPSDDYFVLFVNSTSGYVLATSEKFSILPSTPTTPHNTTRIDPSVPTITISGTPNPTRGWLATFPVTTSKANSARAMGVRLGREEKELGVLPILVTVLGCVFGVALVV